MSARPQTVPDSPDHTSVIDALIERGRAAMDSFASASQERLDEAVTALAWSI